MPIELHHLGPGDVSLMRELLKMFGKVFNDMNTYTANLPSESYLRRLLDGDSFIALAALMNGKPVCPACRGNCYSAWCSRSRLASSIVISGWHSI